MLASRLGPIELIEETHETPITVRDTIAKLDKIKAGEQHEKDLLHRSRNLDVINMKRIKAMPKNG